MDQSQRDMLRQVIDIDPSFIFVKDRRGRFTLVNEALAAAYGTTVEGLIGKTDADFNPNGDEVAQFRAADLRVMDSQQELRIPDEVITDASGNVRHLQTIKRPLVDPDGVARHVLGVATDITELRQVERARRELQERVLHAQKLESLGVLAGGIAHDFNNLLVGVLANVDLLEPVVATDSPQAGALSRIQRAAERASELCHLMLAYSGRRPFDLESICLSDLTRGTAELLEAAVGSARLELDLLPELFVHVDKGQMVQVLLNLVTNAAEAVDGPNAQVRLRTGSRLLRDEDLVANRTHEPVAPGRFAFIEVSDNGPGLSEAAQERMFDPFYTTKFSGRGLGLAAVLGIVRGHGGAITVQSEPGKHTTVSMFLPQSEAPAASPEAARSVSSGAPASAVILVVDDDPVVRETVAELLEMHGLRVDLASGGAEALELFAVDPARYHGVLLDLTMPGMSGLEALRALRALRKSVPVVLMSGYSSAEAGQALQRGVAFLQKPFAARELLQVISRMEPKSD